MPVAHVEDLAEKRREALHRALAEADMTPADAARAAGLSTPNQIYNFFKGRSQSLSRSTLVALAKVIPGATPEKLEGAPEPKIADATNSVLVRAQATSGLWRPAPELPLAEQFEAPLPLQTGMRSAGAFGCLVRAPGAEARYPDGTILLCIPPDRHAGELADGNSVILERSGPRGVETSVRRLELMDGIEAWLWPSTRDPRHQQPLQMPWPWNGRPWREDDERRRIAGVVCGSWRPEC